MKHSKSFTLLELSISIVIISVLMLASIQALDVAQKSETAQIRKTILSVEAKRAKETILRDIVKAKFRSIDVTQRDVTTTFINTWSRKDDVVTTAPEIADCFGSKYKICSAPLCGWYTRFDPVTNDRNLNSAQLYASSSSTGLIGMTATNSTSGRVWSGDDTVCPIDGANLVQTGIPFKLVKMITAEDRLGRFRTFGAGLSTDGFMTPDWQGFVFYVNDVNPVTGTGKLLRYVIYKDDLDLLPDGADVGTAIWNTYSLLPPLPAFPLPDNIIPPVPGLTAGSIPIGIPTLMNLFDWNGNGELEINPSQMFNVPFFPVELDPPITLPDAGAERFLVELNATNEPEILWTRSLVGGSGKNFTIRINLRTNQITWTHNFTGSTVWTRTAVFSRAPTIVANNVVQWDMMTNNASRPFWDAAAPLFPNPVNVDKYVRLVIVFDKPYIDGGFYKHDEFVLETGVSTR